MVTSVKRPEIFDPVAASRRGERLQAGVVGATGMVGQQLIRMLRDHPWCALRKLGASPASAGKKYGDAVAGRWWMDFELPDFVAEKIVEVGEDVSKFARGLDVVFCAVDMPKDRVKALEDKYAKEGVFVVSCNSAYRTDPLVPMVVPYVNPEHIEALAAQRAEKGYDTGAIIVKSNCSIQSYVIPLQPLKEFGIKQIRVHSEQAVSGAGKTLASWSEARDNVIPFIPGEEAKSETEPLKLWGTVGKKGIEPAIVPHIKARCIRVGVADGHTAYVNVEFSKGGIKADDILKKWSNFTPCAGLPSAALKAILYRTEPDRPQPLLDVMRDNGMGVTVGQLKDEGDNWFSFTGLSHNAILGAAGGAVLAAELAAARGCVYHRTAV